MRVVVEEKVNETTRRYPRSEAEAFPWEPAYAASLLRPAKPAPMPWRGLLKAAVLIACYAIVGTLCVP